jgi:hypothetical protein
LISKSDQCCASQTASFVSDPAEPNAAVACSAPIACLNSDANSRQFTAEAEENGDVSGAAEHRPAVGLTLSWRATRLCLDFGWMNHPDSWLQHPPLSPSAVIGLGADRAYRGLTLHHECLNGPPGRTSALLRNQVPFIWIPNPFIMGILLHTKMPSPPSGVESWFETEFQNP